MVTFHGMGATAARGAAFPGCLAGSKACPTCHFCRSAFQVSCFMHQALLWRKHRMKPIMKAATWRRVRQTVQAVALLLFLYLLLGTRQGGATFLPHDLFFRLDPLAGLTAMLAGRRWIASLALGGVTLLLTLLLGRVWCGWLCPAGHAARLDVAAAAPRRRARPARWMARGQALPALHHPLRRPAGQPDAARPRSHHPALPHGHRRRAAATELADHGSRDGALPFRAAASTAGSL